MQLLVRNAPGNGPASPELASRLRWLVVVVLVAMLILIARLWQLQVVRGRDYYEKTVSNVVHERHLPSIRGRILDRKGVVLADNRPSFAIHVRPEQFDEAALRRLGDALGFDDEEFKTASQRLADGAQRDQRASVLLLEDQDKSRAAMVAQASLRFPGLEVQDELYRFYPHGQLAAHVLGYMNRLRADELETLSDKGYSESDRIGRYGLEKGWELYLRGKKGVERYVADAKGERVDGPVAEELISGNRFEPPVAGHTVILTLDSELQRAVEHAVRNHPAAAVAVIDVRTGQILSLVSTPAFDPNTMTGRLSESEWSMLMSDPRLPFVDKTLRQYYPPASTFKFVAGVAALEDGIVDEYEKIKTPSWYRVGKRVFHGDSCDERTNLLEAIQNSCNTYFWKLAEEATLDRLAVVARDFGFGAATGLGLNGDLAGRMPTRAWYEERGERFRIGYTLNAAIGQGDVEVTVLQLAMAYAAIANGGKLFVPQIVSRVENSRGESVVEYPPELRRRVSASPKTLESLRRGMWRVVNHVGGTVFENIDGSEIEFAGKTGTAQVRNKRREPENIRGWHPHRHHAWFAGFAPVVEPKVAVVVLIEHGGSGGKVAGPVARDVFNAYARTAAESSAPTAITGRHKSGAAPEPASPLQWSGVEEMYPNAAATMREYQQARQEGD